MCGIAGVVSRSARVDETIVERMVSSLRHRGPDHSAVQGSYSKGLGVGLGYCRLSIVDLSPAGNQPMSNETDEIWLVYNGELYNHPGLRGELERKGHQYRSRADTETVLHAYEEWGTGCFSRFNGMFALALHDTRSGALLLARDKRGIKPLYYRWDGHSLAFASELKALLTSHPARPDVDPTALWLYLCLGFVPSPYSIVSGVQKLEPGHFLELRQDSMRLEQYASPDAFDGEASSGDVVRRIRNTLEAAVKRQLMSDVPIGVFLSGGLDSTIVAALAARHHGDRIHTFSAGYAESTGRSSIDQTYNDDMVVARQVARELGTEHHEVLIDNADSLADEFAELVFQLDEPMVEPVFVTSHYLARLARQCGVPVVLTGDGADELFGGYDRYFSAARLEQYRRLPGLKFVLPFIQATSRTPTLRRSAHELRYLLAHRSAVAGYIRFSTIYRPEQALGLISPRLRADVDTGALERLIDRSMRPTPPFADQMAHADLALWVGEHFNPRIDRMSMLHSVEARVPFQDDEVVRLALSIPTHMKSTRHDRKALLRNAFAALVPQPALARSKRTFQAPGRAWLEGGLAEGLKALSHAGANRRELFDGEHVVRYANSWGRDTPGNVFAVSALLIANVWADAYLD